MPVRLPSVEGGEIRRYAPGGTVHNPERGFYARGDFSPDQTYSYLDGSSTSLVHGYFRLDNFRDAQLSPELIFRIGKGLDAVRVAGKKAIVRFAYNHGPWPNCEPDAAEGRILGHIDQLAEVLSQNQDMIAWFEAGFIGCWGEWHASSHHLHENMEAKLRIVTRMVQVWPDRPIQVRYPRDLRALRAHLKGAGLDERRLGLHNDCIFASEPDDFGTWGRGESDVRSDKALVAEVSAHAPIGGETCNPSARANCETALKEFSAQGWSDLNQDFHAGVLQTFREQGCYEEIEQKLGYLFRLREATFNPRVQSGRTIRVAAILKNEGWAGMYNPRSLFVVLARGESWHVIESGADPRSWRPGQEVLVDVSAELPVSLNSGVYRLGFWLPDSSQRLRDDPRYAVQFSNEGTWDDAQGLNVLGDLTVADSDFAVGGGGAASDVADTE